MGIELDHLAYDRLHIALAVDDAWPVRRRGQTHSPGTSSSRLAPKSRDVVDGGGRIVRVAVCSDPPYIVVDSCVANYL
jgi:hypothetical protein